MHVFHFERKTEFTSRPSEFTFWYAERCIWFKGICHALMSPKERQREKDMNYLKQEKVDLVTTMFVFTKEEKVLKVDDWHIRRWLTIFYLHTMGKKQLHILFINACFITKKQKKQTRNEREEEECLYLHYGRLKIYTSYTGMRSSIRTRHIGHFLHFSQHVLQTTSTRHNKNLQHERNSRKQMVSNKQVNIKS